MKIGPMAWLAFTACILESLIALKYSEGQYPHLTDPPLPVVVGWTIVLSGLFLFTIFYFYVFRLHEKKATDSKLKTQ